MATTGLSSSWITGTRLAITFSATRSVDLNKLSPFLQRNFAICKIGVTHL